MEKYLLGFGIAFSNRYVTKVLFRYLFFMWIIEAYNFRFTSRLVKLYLIFFFSQNGCNRFVVNGKPFPNVHQNFPFPGRLRGTSKCLLERQN